MDNHLNERLHLHLEQQRAAYLAEPYPTLAVRRDRLTRLIAMLNQHGPAIADAISADFGHRSLHESRLIELFAVKAAAKHARRHLRRWMKVRRMPTPLHFLPGHN